MSLSLCRVGGVCLFEATHHIQYCVTQIDLDVFFTDNAECCCTTYLYVIESVEASIAVSIIIHSVPSIIKE